MKSTVTILLVAVILSLPLPARADDPCDPYNASCSTTEQKFVDHIAGCYACIANAECLDDTLWSDVGLECEDLQGVAQGGARAGTSRTQLCWDLIDCMLATGCASIDVTACFCGSQTGGPCATQSTSKADGLCKQEELDAMEMFNGDPVAYSNERLPDTTLASGMANEMFGCANGGNCQLCTQ